MPGGQFGGAGATGRWNRRFANRGRSWSGRGSLRRTRPRGIRGGTFHKVASLTLTAQTTEETAAVAFLPVITPGLWLDSQLFTETPSATRYWEGSLDSTYVTGITCSLAAWLTTEANLDVQQYCPLILAWAVVPWFDAQITGDPGSDYTPIVLPNLFQRDFGHFGPALETASAGEATAANVSQSAMQARVIRRDWRLLAVGAINAANGDWGRVSASHRLKGFAIRRNQMFGALIAGYNTNTTENCIIGYQAAGTFGYRHRTSTG